ncbi:hypothetical protein FRC12_021638 [Ceratobasidium sp. 428]|nr:hypothetical protein FRC12_021638 [Ceratobasidium sp. 428]
MNKIFGRLIGMPDKKINTPGSVTLLPKTSTRSQVRSTPLSWNLFATDKTVFGNCQPNQGGYRYFHILSTVSQSGDSIEVGADILTTDDCFARVQAIYGCVSGTNRYEYFAALRVFMLGDAKHTLLDLPTLTRGEIVVCVSVKNILCAVNLQHDCAKKQACNNMRAIHQVQEREQTSKMRYEVQHSDNDNFVLNLHTCHNAQPIRNALPAHLYSRCTTLFPNRDEVFRSAVGKLNVAKLKKERLNAAKKQVNDTMAEALREVMEGEAEEDEHEETIEAEVAEVLRPKRGKKRKAGGSSRRATKTPKRRRRDYLALVPAHLFPSVSTHASPFAPPIRQHASAATALKEAARTPMLSIPLHTHSSRLVQGIRQEMDQTEHAETCSYLEWALNVKPEDLYDFKTMVRKEYDSTSATPAPVAVLMPR